MTGKSSRKSIVANFGLLSAELENRLSTENSARAPQPVPTARVGAGVIGAAHRAIDDIKSERDRLKALVEAGGGTVRELDPLSIDPRPFLIAFLTMMRPISRLSGTRFGPKVRRFPYRSVNHLRLLIAIR